MEWKLPMLSVYLLLTLFLWIFVFPPILCFFWLPAYSKSMKIKCSHGCIHSVPKTLPEKECYSHFTVLRVNPIPNTFKPLSLNTARKEEAERRAEVGWHQKPSPGKGKGRGEWDTGAPTPHKHTHGPSKERCMGTGGHRLAGWVHAVSAAPEWGLSLPFAVFVGRSPWQTFAGGLARFWHLNIWGCDKNQNITTIWFCAASKKKTICNFKCSFKDTVSRGNSCFKISTHFLFAERNKRANHPKCYRLEFQDGPTGERGWVVPCWVPTVIRARVWMGHREKMEMTGCVAGVSMLSTTGKNRNKRNSLPPAWQWDRVLKVTIIS